MARNHGNGKDLRVIIIRYISLTVFILGLIFGIGVLYQLGDVTLTDIIVMIPLCVAGLTYSVCHVCIYVGDFMNPQEQPIKSRVMNSDGVMKKVV